MQKLLSASFALAMAVPLCATAQSQPNSISIQNLRQEIDAMRQDYETRIKAMEIRLEVAEHAAAVNASAPQVAATSNPSQPSATAETPMSNANAFNPAMSLVLSGLYASTSVDPANYNIAGFQLSKVSGAGPGSRGFNLTESELGFSANIDPWLRGAANISLHSDDSVSVEEAYIQSTSLGNGVTAKAGRFLSGIGYLNSHHSHTWDFVDSPLAYQALLGTQYGDDGIQISWLPPTDQYIELGFELGRGKSFPGSNTGRNGASMSALTLHTGGDVGESHSWRAGVSLLGAQANDLLLDNLNGSGTLVTSAFTGNTKVWIVDGVWKWAPNGNVKQTNFKLQGEYISSARSGQLSYDVTGANTGDGYVANQSGWYLQGVYQFMPEWRVGLRTEQLDAGSPNYGINSAALLGTGYRPSKDSVMLDYNPSEFSRVRLQLSQDRARENQTDNQFFLQYQMSLGAHGAHGY